MSILLYIVPFSVLFMPFGIGGGWLKVDKALVLRAMNGEKDAFSEIYYLYYKDFYNFAVYSLGNAEDAADAVADAFVDIFKGIGKLRNPESFSAWAFKILSIRCKKVISERIKRRGELDFDELFETPFTAFENIEEDIAEKVTAMNALFSLEPEERMIVVLYVIHGYKKREIAKMIGRPIGTVSSKLFRAFSKLRKMLEEKE